MSHIFHNIFIKSYSAVSRLISPWNPKARLWIQGRKNLFNKIETAVKSLPIVKNTVWVHCASLGEFEQGRPLIEQIKTDYPQTNVVVTFFSPSGYEVRKNYKGANLVFYLPEDTARNARKFVDLIQPTLVLWIRYEYWYYFLKELKHRNIPLLLVSGVIRNNSIFFKPWGGFWRNMLGFFTHLFVQNSDSHKALAQLGFNENVTVSGDTRFDRVTATAEQFEPIEAIAAFCRGYRVLVAGSTWTEDEEEFTHYVKENKYTRFIFAPHEVDDDNIRDVQKLFPSSILFSGIKGNPDAIKQNPEANTLIIDNIGMLSRLYYYADIAYVGGGFGDDGLHNILEPAVFGKPVVFGPNYEKHFEAIGMIEEGGAISVENALELETVLNRLWFTPHELQKRGEAAANYIAQNKGATQIVLDYIYKNRLLTN